ncbi:homocysteine biosynthesis protein [Desulfofalx alkaliphila]|uniref:homocysteine biosynthesis protein n=1 Tax=Desulfofalx alkaliphila TaxID=105483 RepID=UPI0004E1FAD4|nr:homocysteine biosynthesis protein [Desulfofalx alkaliphila]
MAVEKTYAEINAKIKSGQAVVLTAEEVVSLVAEKGVTQAAKEVDVVTTGTFGPMCSSGAFLNFGHPKPRMRMSKVLLNNVPAYAGIAAVDAYIGATEPTLDDPLNKKFPGEFRYGGGHVIEDLVAGKPVKLKAQSYGTDCYPLKELETEITLQDINEAFLFNPRNAYQNYNCAVNLSDRTKYTYMGMLKPKLANAHYSTSGQLSPLLKDPHFLTIGIGTRIFLGGGEGYVAWYGTQHFPSMLNASGVELHPSGGTLSVIGDLKQMNQRYIRGCSFIGYGCSLAVGIGIPIPVLNEEVMYWVSRSDKELYAPIVDYSDHYPNRTGENLGFVSYADLKSGEITVNGKKVKTAPLSSYPMAVEIATELKERIKAGKFELTQPVQQLPSAKDNIVPKSLNVKE